MAGKPAKPGRNCPLCPRLAAFREAWRAREPSWFNAPVPSFGPLDARLLIVGLAPGLRGANRTGRPFTGDFAGDLLYATMKEYGFARGTFEQRADRRAHVVLELSLLALQHQHRRADAADVSRGVCCGAQAPRRRLKRRAVAAPAP